jgi:hypothetical protein
VSKAATKITDFSVASSFATGSMDILNINILDRMNKLNPKLANNDGGC